VNLRKVEVHSISEKKLNLVWNILNILEKVEDIE
jgi:hypothetical protein